MSSVQPPCHGEQTSDPAQDHRSLRRKKNLVPAVYANGQRLPRESSLKLQVVGHRVCGGHSVPVLVSSGPLTRRSRIFPMMVEVAFVAIVVASCDPMYEVYILPRIAVYILYVPDLRKLAAQSGLQTFRP